ncbi:MAG TPA: hypothetical protein PLD79_04215, partial [Halothiobacillus sp.]|nr:hypothetical protein [Halothiobacillus sp.]
FLDHDGAGVGVDPDMHGICAPSVDFNGLLIKAKPVAQMESGAGAVYPPDSIVFHLGYALHFCTVAPLALGHGLNWIVDGLLIKAKFCF